MPVPKQGFFVPLLFVALLLSEAASGQITVKGQVKDQHAGKPLPGVNVYLAGTTFGQSTDSGGKYEISLSEAGRYNLVFSFVGYKKQVRLVELNPHSSVIFNIEMKKKVEQLEEIHVIASNKKWRKQYDFFFDQFIGKSQYAKEVTIENPWVLTFAEANGDLVATANKPIIITNRALGYKLYIELVQFRWPERRDRGGVYKILSRYEPLSPHGKNQRHHWEKNRRKNYLGSSTHFLKTVYNDNIKKSDFSVPRLWDLSTLSEGEKRYRLMTTTNVSKSAWKKIKGYKLTHMLEIKYRHITKYEIGGRSYSLSIKKEGAMQPTTRSHIFFLYENGILLDPASVAMYKNWADERVANSLPTNYSIKD
ncbi:MAG: carboxypeptidase-like regulatory domain-containing protein [Balneolaceae bacterium]|jgi:hypothetical protein